MGPSAMLLATPLIAGPGAIKATLLLESRAGGNSLWLLALVLIIAAVALASAPSPVVITYRPYAKRCAS
jgi:small neutral amino acid transporter SnatA (MarC family)